MTDPAPECKIAPETQARLEAMATWVVDYVELLKRYPHIQRVNWRE